MWNSETQINTNDPKYSLLISKKCDFAKVLYMCALVGLAVVGKEKKVEIMLFYDKSKVRLAVLSFAD